MNGLLEVVVLTAEDARRAEQGGADALMLVGELTGQGRCPEPAVFRRVREACSLPIRPLLRLRDGYRSDGGEITRLRGLAASYLADGAEGFVLGFLNGYSQVDTQVVEALTAEGCWPWTFDHAIDRCADPDEAWQSLESLRGIDRVLTAGSARGLRYGLDDLLTRVKSDPRAAKLAMAGGGLSAAHVPWLTRAGVTRFHIGAQAREHGSFASEVDILAVRAWRILLDAEASRTPGESSAG